jgi:Leucine-rich repeat (LRR) protein
MGVNLFLTMLLARYFIIIDDIREASDWEEIKWAFPDTNNLGSRILITTRVTSIAEACCSRYSCDGLVLKMEPLNQNDSARLLLAKVVGSVDGCLPHNMKLLCDEILRRCDGIPLFIIGMADWLIKEQLQQQQQQQQEGVVDQDEKHESFAIYCQGQVPYLPERLEQSLSFAFNNDLPNNELRPLLLSMSMLPYGYKLDKDRLIHKQIVSRWEAERFLSELVDRNVITCVASNCKHNNVGEAEACQWQVNHFMHQFLVSKSAEIGFIFTTATLSIIAAAALPAATGRGNEPSSSRMPRRLALHHPDPLLPSLLETMDLSQTRSLAVSGAVSGIPLDKFVNLVELDLEGWENLKDEDLLQVCRSKMVFLDYLSVRNTRVSKLPHEIKELRTLTTLDVSYTQITELPHEIKEMWILRTLDVSYTQITELPHEIKELRSLETLDISYTQINELPLELFQLTDLEHLDLRGTQISQLPKQIVGLRGKLVRLFVGSERSVNSVETAMPHDVRRLYELQTLATVDLIQHPASFVRALGDLQMLEVLAVTWSFHQSTDRDYCEALLSSIGKWSCLESLTIHCGLGCSMEFLGSLEKSHAPRGLKKFKVTAGRFASVPPWIDGLKHLAFVQITVCNKQTTTDDLKILGDLPKLQCLILGLDFIPGQAIVIEDAGFRQLQRFSVDCPMPWLTFSTGAMRKLAYLQLKFCSTPANQICVPSGIRNLRRLTEVSLCYNAQYINSPSIKMTVEAVTKQVAEHRNPIDLFINGIEQDDVQQVDDEVTEIIIGTSSRTNAGAEDDTQAVGEEATAAIECEITEAES